MKKFRSRRCPLHHPHDRRSVRGRPVLERRLEHARDVRCGRGLRHKYRQAGHQLPGNSASERRRSQTRSERYADVWRRGGYGLPRATTKRSKGPYTRFAGDAESRGGSDRLGHCAYACRSDSLLGRKRMLRRKPGPASAAARSIACRSATALTRLSPRPLPGVPWLSGSR